MKRTLLDLVQDILNDMDSDEVNSIDDTVESAQVAQIVKTCYLEMATNRNWDYQRKLMQLTAVGSTSRPNYLIIPEDVKELELFKYNKIRDGETVIRWEDVKYKEPDAFLRYISSRNSDNDTVLTVTDFSGTSLLILNNAPPTFWTSFDDTYIITDSYDNSVDSSLQAAKTQCVAYASVGWTHTDSAIPIMPEEAFPALLAEAKSTCFFALKQMANQKEEQKAGRQNRWLSRKAWRAAGGVKYQNYGRKGKR